MNDKTSDVPAREAPPQRLVSLDAYRGFTMILMASAGLSFSHVAKKYFPESPFWQFLGHHTDHVPWVGCSLWDLIQPAFMFMVGVALPYSIAARKAKGDSFAPLLAHTLWRSFLLVALAIFLSSMWSKSTSWTFTNVLAQIGLGYPFLFMLAWTKPRWQFAAAIGILLAYWAAFALYPLPPADFDYTKVGLPKDWNFLTGFAAHWEKNVNVAAAFDQWFLNLFPQKEKPGGVFVFNNGGYQTLNFIPSLATMIFGLLAGELLRSERSPMEKVKWLVGAGIAGLAIGYALNLAGICPLVKRIWTPSWAIFSTGWTLLFLAVFYFIIDVKGWKAWAFFCVVVGMNSIAMYCLAQASKKFVLDSGRIHLGTDIFKIAGEPYAPILESATALVVWWLICLWMYKRKLFLKI